ncbi:MAG: cobyrinate a,c-diamide synthase [Aliidongia sp.]
MPAERGLVLAAPASGSGKTTLTLGLLRAYRRRGIDIVGAKSTPASIAPHPAVPRPISTPGPCGRSFWPAVSPGSALISSCAKASWGCSTARGAAGDIGSTADLAALAGWPVVLVVDARGQSASAAALLRGFASHRPDVPLTGVIFNRVAGTRHAAMLRAATATALPGLPVLGAVPRDAALELPSRHLGLVLAEEHAALDAFLDRVADAMATSIDLDALAALARRSPLAGAPPAQGIPPFGQHIAVARDQAFAFAYPHLLDAWRRAGAELSVFLAAGRRGAGRSGRCRVSARGDIPSSTPGASPRLRDFLDGLRRAAARQARIYGECGGYMVLGDTLIDRDGTGHEMAGLLPVTTSFAAPRRHLGYRRAQTLAGPWPGLAFRAHEFHFAEQVSAPGARGPFPRAATPTATSSAVPERCAAASPAPSFI